MIIVWDLLVFHNEALVLPLGLCVFFRTDNYLFTPILSPKVNCRGREDAQEASIYNVWCASKVLDAKIA